MAEDPESTAEIAQVLETTEAAAEQEESAIAPVVLPPEPTAEAKEIPKPEENSPAVEINPDEPRVQEETGPPPEMEPAEGGPIMEKKLTFSSKLTDVEFIEAEAAEDELKEVTEDVGWEPTGLKSATSQDELRKILNQERKQRLKDARTIRFRVHPPQVLVERVDREEEEEQEDEDREEAREEALMEEPQVNEPMNWENIEDQEEEDEGEMDKWRSLGTNMMSVYGPLREDSDDIFYKDPKYDTEDDKSLDNISILSAKSNISSRSMKSMRSMDSIELKSDFLRNFEIPSLSDISEEQEPEPLRRSSKSSVVSSVSLTDDGHFVDPLTGELLPSSESISESESECELATEPEPRRDSSNLSDIPELPGFPSEVPYPKPNVRLTFDEFIATTGRVAFEDEYDVTDRVQGLELEAMVKEYVDILLNRLVTTYERQQWKNVQRSKCDKEKLLNELQSVTSQYIFENYTNGLLAGRLTDYYKRLKNTRVFAQLDEQKETQYSNRYMEALAKVDWLKYHLDAVKHLHALQMNKVILDLHSAQNLVSFTEAKLEQTMRKHLARPDSEFLPRYVDYVLRQMTAKRNEISDMRLTLITKKHNLGHLRERINIVEALSSTVSIQDFISLQNKTIALEKKREERSAELAKLRTQYLMDVHLTHHIREKTLALGDQLQLRKITLQQTVQKHRILRSTLYQQKLERTKIRERRKELTYQGGILAMPSLMYEYDNTVQQLKASQERVSKLRDSVKALNQRISIAEGRSI